MRRQNKFGDETPASNEHEGKMEIVRDQ